MPDPLLPEAVPSEYGGKWLAWTSDALKIAGVGETPEQAKAEAASTGVVNAILEWVPPADGLLVGRQL